MKKIKHIDTIKIGLMTFEAYIIQDNNNLEAFGIYLQNNDKPLLLFQQDVPNEKIDIQIDSQLVNDMQKLKSKDSDQRKEHFKTFQEFVLESEQVAKELVFKNKKLIYMTDVQLLKSIENTYLIE